MDAKLRMSPRFSLNKIAEYMTATPRRRRSLIIDQIRPPIAKVINYEDARRVLVRFFCDPDRTPKKLLEAAAALRDRAAGSHDEHRIRCLISSARALESFAPFSERVRPKAVVAVGCPRQGADLALGGVRIVVSPDVSLLEPGTERCVGAVKLHFSRSAPLGAEELAYAATIVHECLSDKGYDPIKARCFSVDVFAQIIETVPRSVKDRVKNLEAACEEIAERWPKLLEALKSLGVIGDNA